MAFDPVDEYYTFWEMEAGSVEVVSWWLADGHGCDLGPWCNAGAIALAKLADKR